jgi:hypothetical protein
MVVCPQELRCAAATAGPATCVCSPLVDILFTSSALIDGHLGHQKETPRDLAGAPHARCVMCRCEPSTLFGGGGERLVAASGRQTTLGASGCVEGGASSARRPGSASSVSVSAARRQQNSVSSHERSSSLQSHLKLPTPPLRNCPKRISPRQGL